MSSLVTKIGKQVNQMTKSQKKVANYLLFNMDKLLFFTADELAKAANVSTATVVRFARELDFEGYTDMQKAGTAPLPRPGRGAGGPAPVQPGRGQFRVSAGEVLPPRHSKPETDVPGPGPGRTWNGPAPY